MLSDLFVREFDNFNLINLKLSKRLLKIISFLVSLAFIIFLETYLFIQLHNKIGNIVGLFSSLISIYYFCFCIFLILYSIVKYYKIFFGNKKERIILGSKPISVSSIIFSKVLFNTLRIFLISIVAIYPFLFLQAYFNNYQVSYYFLAFVNIIFSSLIISFISLLLVMPYKYIYENLKRLPVVLVVLTLGLGFLFTYFYSVILDFFISVVRSTNLDNLFTINNIEYLNNLSSSLFPINFMMDLMVRKNVIFNLVMILIFIFSLLSISILCFYYFYKHYLYSGENSKQEIVLFKRKSRVNSQSIALVKKELSLTFKNDEGVFSFVFLVCIQPFLIYLVISSIHLIFSTGNLTYIKSLYPNFISALDTFLILIFILIFNSNSSASLKKEINTLKLIKSLPISPLKQICFKMLVPYCFSILSYFITVLVLLVTNLISYYAMLFLLFIGLIGLSVLFITSTISDVKSKASDFVGTFTSLILPLIFVFIGVLFTLIPKLSIPTDIVFYLVVLFLEIALLGMYLIKIKSRLTKAFIEFGGQ